MGGVIAVAEGIHTLALPTLLPVGTVNAYLVAGDPVTLVDTGPSTGETYDALVRELRRVGYGVEEVEWILITHGHVDHYGLSTKIRAAGDAEIFVHQGDRDLVEDFHRAFRVKRDFFEDQMRLNGVPDATLVMIEEFFEYLVTLGDETPVAGTFKDGDVLDTGSAKLRVLHTPGHSPGSCCFLTEDGVLFSGDTLLGNTTSNAVFGGAEGTTTGLSDHIESLHRLTREEVREVRPGHGDPFTDVPRVVGAALRQHEERKEAILKILEQGEATAFDLSVSLFGSLPLEEVFLGVCEVLGQLEILDEEALVTATEEGGRRTYSRAR
jgi:glyoxylase-like metal-dependent hydrolase (beta-lactamase superfamily II)